MGTEFHIKKRLLNAFAIACIHDFVCACTSLCLCVRAFGDLLRVFLARKTKENKHRIYYSNEYALGSKWYNFPAPPQAKNAKNIQGKPVTFDFPRRKTLQYSDAAWPPEPLPLGKSQYTPVESFFPANWAVSVQQNLINIWADNVTIS